jgi:hypothetical protein
VSFQWCNMLIFIKVKDGGVSKDNYP